VNLRSSGPPALPKRAQRLNLIAALLSAAIFSTAAQSSSNNSAEVATRAQIAAATFEDTIVVDCQLPGRLQQLGGMRTYLTPGQLTRLPAIDCRARGGEYTIGELSSGTLSLKRWLPLAEKDNVEAEYYVAHIYANGTDGVPEDYVQAAKWYQRAADKKYAPAMQELGYLYEQGLGVPKDSLAGLKLQRAAAGLGDDLVYASELAANKEESAAQIASLTDQLDAASANVTDLQGQLAQADDKLLQSDAQLSQDRTRLRDLRAKLEQARQGQGAGDPARVRQLQEQLAATEAELKQKQAAVGTLSAEQELQRAQLSAQLVQAQATNSKLNDMLAASQSESQSLRTKLAQSEQRTLQSEHELNAMRADFLKQTSQLSARSAELQRLREHGTDSLQTVLDSKQAEMDRQQSLVSDLEGQLAAIKKQLTTAGSSSSDAQARNRELESTLAALRVQYAQQQQELQTQRSEFTKLQSQSKDDRAALVAQISAQLAAKSSALEDEQRRITALQTETAQLRDAYNKEREQHSRDSTTATGEQAQNRDALRVAQAQLQQQREALQQLQMQSAARQLQLVQEREKLAAQLSGGQQAQQTNQQRIASLESDLRERDKQIADARAKISALEQQSAAATVTANAAKVASTPSNVSYRMPQAPGGQAPNPLALIDMVRALGPANYHALIIGNSNYRYLPALKTPANDARDVAKLLEGRYGFDVKLLINATRREIAQAMLEYEHTLSDTDRLLIYYAGHGGSRVLPPEQAYWLGVDSSPDDDDTWLGAEKVSSDISQIHARHVLLVADSCFSSVITHPTSTIVAPSNDERSVRIKWTRSARMVLTSGQNEPVVDSAETNPTHSLFAEQFLTVLRQNDILLSGEELAHELSARMAQAAARIGVKQTPTYSNLQDQQHMYGDFFFVPVASTAQVASNMR
jgi:hypothetical protein